MSQQPVRFRHIPVSAPKHIPATLKVSKDGTSVSVIQPRTKTQTAHITVAYLLDQETAILSLAFAVCHPDDAFNKWHGKLIACTRFDRGETVEIIIAQRRYGTADGFGQQNRFAVGGINVEPATVHLAINDYVSGYVFHGTDDYLSARYFRSRKDNVDPQVKESLLRWGWGKHAW